MVPKKRMDHGYWRSIASRASDKWYAASGFIALWRSDKNGLPSNGGSDKESARPGLIRKIDGPLKICGPRALHATLNPEKWHGERLWIVALRGELAFGGDKIGALEREIICEVTND